MRVAPLPEDEDQRLACLTSLDLLDTPPEPAFERTARLAQALSGAPIALVTLIDRERQWFKAKLGLEITETHRDLAFCAHAIVHGGQTLWIEDARRDERFCGNPLVTASPFIRFYAGAPITMSGGERIGTVCVIGPEPRAYDAKLDQGLADLAAMMADDCALRLARSELAEAHKAEAKANEHLRMALDIADLGVWELSYADRRLSYHRKAKSIFDWTPKYDDIAHDLMTVVHPEDRPRIEAAWYEHLRTGAPYRGEYRIRRDDGRTVWVQSVAELIKGPDGRPERVVGVMHDVTALTEARLGAEAASAAKGRFLADMSHEFRTPLNGVLGVSGALARTSLDETQAHMVELIERSAEALEALLADTLLQLDVAPLAAPLEEPAPAPVDRPAQRARVLLAEDHAVNRKVVELILGALDFDLTMVEDGAQALAATQATRFDLILMDINMPVMDGLTAIRSIRAEEAGGPRTPILAVTANALPEQIAEVFMAGADGHVAKPVNAEKLTAAVLNALAGVAEQPPELRRAG